LDALFDAPDRDGLLTAVAACPSLIFLPSGGAGPDAWLVHAGVHPRWTDLDTVATRLNRRDSTNAWLTDPDISYAANIRCCRPDGSAVRGTGPTCASGTVGWDSLYRGDTLIVHGHWATRGHYRGPRTLGLDSGCVYGGPLTAWCQDQDRIITVPSRQAQRS
jgi:bis(5'-nucleosyl)-tetraphosphatase (symmetrical)